jgi:hypothetical protein
MEHRFAQVRRMQNGFIFQRRREHLPGLRNGTQFCAGSTDAKRIYFSTSKGAFAGAKKWNTDLRRYDGCKTDLFFNVEGSICRG